MKWNTEKRKVSELKAYDNNPRQITDVMFEKLKQSIDNIGYVELIAIDTDNTIVAGHMRVKALIALGRGDEIVEVRVPERKLTKEEFEKYLLVSNKVTGGWDYNKLANCFDNEFLFDAGFEPFELGIDSSGKEEIDKDNINNSLNSYLDSNIKQIVLYFKSEDHLEILERLEILLKSENVPDYSALFLLMLEHFEETKSSNITKN